MLAALFIISSFVTVGFSQETNSSSESDWKITIDGTVETPITLTLAEITAMPQTSVQAELTCYGLPLANGWWTGVKLWSVLEKAGITTNMDITFLAADGYMIPGFPMDDAKRDDVLLAYELDGVALPEIIRLVVPGANGNVWVKLITKITIGPASSQASPILPQGSPVPVTQNPNVQAPAISQFNLPKRNESAQELPTAEPNIVQEESQETAPEQTNQPTEQPQQNVQDAQEPVIPTDYSSVVVAISAVLAASVAAGALFVKRRKANQT